MAQVPETPPAETPAAETPAAEPAPEAAPEPAAEPAPEAAPAAAPAGPVPPAAAAFTEAAVAPPDPEADDTVWTLSLGTTLVYGNARSFALSAGTHLQIRRDIHQFMFDAAFAYGLASVRDPMGAFPNAAENARNTTGRLRYDIWPATNTSIFASVSGRNDPFAGLDFRFQGQLGVAHNVINEQETKHRFWGELGWDFTLDYATTRIPNIEYPFYQTGPRVFIGYDNHLNDSWRFLTGIEALPGVREQNNGGGNAFDMRVNWSSELQVTLVQSLAVTFKFQFLYDTVPALIINDNIDTTTTLTLQYTLL